MGQWHQAGPEICNQCVRLWVTFCPLWSSAFNFATRKDVLMLLLMASNLLKQDNRKQMLFLKREKRSHSLAKETSKIRMWHNISQSDS
jgi:hypothetical protein